MCCIVYLARKNYFEYYIASNVIYEKANYTVSICSMPLQICLFIPRTFHSAHIRQQFAGTNRLALDICLQITQTAYHLQALHLTENTVRSSLRRQAFSQTFDCYFSQFSIFCPKKILNNGRIPVLALSQRNTVSFEYTKAKKKPNTSADDGGPKEDKTIKVSFPL